MAQTFPNSRFFGYDSHPASIELARKRAAAAGVSDRVTFDVARRQRVSGARVRLGVPL
jgi:23S rRNA G2445 N2-methylase RlmL